MNEVTNIERLTKLSSEVQNKDLRFFARIPLTIKLKVLKVQPSIFHSLKSKNSDVDKSMLTLASLILAIQKVTAELDDVALNIAKDKTYRVHESSKRAKLLGYWSLVKSLRLEKKLSLRKIQTYLKKYHKFDVSYSTIRNVWIEIEENENG